MARTKILLKGVPNIDEQTPAGEAITPGMLVQVAATVVKHATANGPGHLYALERDEMGDEVSDDYASGDYVKVHSARPGDRIYALIASGQNIAAIGALLGAAADGTVKNYASGIYIGRSLEIVNNAAGPGVARLRMEVY